MATHTNENPEPIVDPGAFWHTNMDLYYGYIPGEVVEVEHEPDKYWLASIKYSFKHLVLLEWVGKYGEEFWVDTSVTNSLTGSSVTPSSNNGFKRLFPLGYHLGILLKSKFKLERPSKILHKPSLYNPSKDPYADIRTVEELLVHEIDDRNNDDVFSIKSTCDTAGLALAKCKTKINFGQEDQDELEAALLSLSGLEHYDESKTQTTISGPNQIDNATDLPAPRESTTIPAKPDDRVLNLGKSNGLESSEQDPAPNSPSITGDGTQVKTNDKSVHKVGTSLFKSQQSSTSPTKEAIELITAQNGDGKNIRTNASQSPTDRASELDSVESGGDSSEPESASSINESDCEKIPSFNPFDQIQSEDDPCDEKELDATRLKLCERLQLCATNFEMYRGIHPTSTKFSDQIFFRKPKQLYDIGGANQERLFVPGTILEVCHTGEDELGQLELLFWFAFVVKNVGGRLTLRWFLHDEPKFKQGRLELKSSKSKFIIERSDQSMDATNLSEGDSNKVSGSLESDNPSIKKQTGISAESITFCLHFCDPKIHTILTDDLHWSDCWFKGQRKYTFPRIIAAQIIEIYGEKFSNDLEDKFYDLVLDTRRVNLDKDRPLIDHVLSVTHKSAPRYLDLIFAENDTKSKREILMSCPKMSKLLRATVKRQFGDDTFEIHSEPLPETGEVIKFIHPFESSYAILPTDWAENHEECLSVHPSRNPSPAVLVESSHETERDSKSLPEITSTREAETSDGVSTPKSKSDDAARKKFQSLNPVPGNREDCLNPERFLYMPSGGVFAIPRKESKLFSEQQWAIISCGYEWTRFDPDRVMQLVRSFESNADSFHFCIDLSSKQEVECKFKVMDLIEVVHPSSDQTICLGRIRKVLFPLMWIQLSADCYTLLPYNSTNIYPHGWCEAHNHKLISLLPPRKRCNPRTPSQCNSDTKRRKKAKVSHESITSDHPEDFKLTPYNEIYEKEHFDLGAIKDRQTDIDHFLNEKSAYIEIFFNHKCFTGPSLSKSKICSLPQYVGPGPMRLVVEEVVTKVISVAYVPPRILNDLSSKSFEELLIERNLTNTIPVEFKAKYQKRVHRDTIPVCVSSDDVALYCECICEHIKCCYNLFGLKLYDGDDCPSHCRSLTKSNKFMKRATYYREKARQGEFLNQNNNENNGTNKKASTNVVDNGINSRTASRARYTGRGSSESTSSSNLSCSDQTISRTSPAVNQTITASNDMKENSISPEAWTVDDVARYLDSCQLGIFKSYMRSEGIDGQALLLLDKATIEEHFQYHVKSEFTQEEVNRLCQIVELIKTNA